MEHVEYLHFWYSTKLADTTGEYRQKLKKSMGECRACITTALVFNDDYSEVIEGDCKWIAGRGDRYKKVEGNKLAYDRAKNECRVHMGFDEFKLALRKFLKVHLDYYHNEVYNDRVYKSDPLLNNKGWLYELLLFLDNEVYKGHVKNFRDIPGNLVFRVLKYTYEKKPDYEAFMSFRDIDFRGSYWMRSGCFGFSWNMII